MWDEILAGTWVRYQVDPPGNGVTSWGGKRRIVDVNGDFIEGLENQDVYEKYFYCIETPRCRIDVLCAYTTEESINDFTRAVYWSTSAPLELFRLAMWDLLWSVYTEYINEQGIIVEFIDTSPSYRWNHRRWNNDQVTQATINTANNFHQPPVSEIVSDPPQLFIDAGGGVQPGVPTYGNIVPPNEHGFIHSGRPWTTTSFMVDWWNSCSGEDPMFAGSSPVFTSPSVDPFWVHEVVQYYRRSGFVNPDEYGYEAFRQSGFMRDSYLGFRHGVVPWKKWVKAVVGKRLMSELDHQVFVPDSFVDSLVPSEVTRMEPSKGSTGGLSQDDKWPPELDLSLVHGDYLGDSFVYLPHAYKASEEMTYLMWYPGRANNISPFYPGMTNTRYWLLAKKEMSTGFHEYGMLEQIENMYSRIPFIGDFVSEAADQLREKYYIFPTIMGFGRQPKSDYLSTRDQLIDVKNMIYHNLARAMQKDLDPIHNPSHRHRVERLMAIAFNIYLVVPSRDVLDEFYDHLIAAEVIDPVG